MNPTMNLRFVERDIFVEIPGKPGISAAKTIKVLQQQFESIDTKTGEIAKVWKDVELVTEE